jgi:hypothetical protein
MKNSNIAIKTWVKRNTNMIPNDLLMSVINEDMNWVEIIKRDDIQIMPRANAWRFREGAENLWVAQYADELADLGFAICCSDMGNYLVLNSGIKSDHLCEQVKIMQENF